MVKPAPSTKSTIADVIASAFATGTEQNPRNSSQTSSLWLYILNRHSTSHGHQQCVELAAGFKSVVTKRADFIESQLSEGYDKQVQAITEALLAIIDRIQFLLKQGLGLRGSNWDKGSKRESKYSPELHYSPLTNKWKIPLTTNSE